MSVDIICPLYQAESYILNLNQSLLRQKDVEIQNISYILTESTDCTEEILKTNHIPYQKIKKSNFSHSLVREKAAMKSKADIVCFVTQDIVIEDDHWLKKLIRKIENGKCEASFSRQISKYNNLEKYTREKNYPEKSRIVSKKDILKLGLNTFFFSDASSAIRRDTFVALKGYDGKNLPINEDMYFAYKLIMNGYRIGYEATSVVYHSHHFTLKELYNRYQLTGRFFKENSYLNQYGTTKAGGGLAKYVLMRALQEKNIPVLFRFPFDMAARYVGMRVGMR